MLIGLTASDKISRQLQMTAECSSRRANSVARDNVRTISNTIIPARRYSRRSLSRTNMKINSHGHTIGSFADATTTWSTALVTVNAANPSARASLQTYLPLRGFRPPFNSAPALLPDCHPRVSPRQLRPSIHPTMILARTSRHQAAR